MVFIFFKWLGGKSEYFVPCENDIKFDFQCPQSIVGTQPHSLVCILFTADSSLQSQTPIAATGTVRCCPVNVLRPLAGGMGDSSPYKLAVVFWDHSS